MISPLVRWEHSEDQYVFKYSAEVTLQVSFENDIPYLTDSIRHHYEDQSRSLHGLFVMKTETHAML